MRQFVIFFTMQLILFGILPCCGNGNDGTNPIWVVPRAEVPECLSDLVDGILKDSRPASYVLRYPGEIVNAFYYNTKLTEDYNYVLSLGCVIQCAPDGGPEGSGDGNCPDYFNEHTEAEIVWCENKNTCDNIDKPI
jgi:hypothetical protein